MMKICLVIQISLDKEHTRFVYYYRFIFIKLKITIHFILFQVIALRTGFRSIPLKNLYSEDIPLASLLVHIRIEKLSVSMNSINKYYFINILNLCCTNNL